MRMPASVDLTSMHACAEEASRLLKTLGNAQRLRVLCLLVRGEMSVGQINEHLPDLSQSALSQHLARLRDEGLVRTRREAQTIWYELPDGPVQAIIATLYRTYCATDAVAEKPVRRPPAAPKPSATSARGRRRNAR